MLRRPPPFAERLLARVAPPGERGEAVLGDLAEEFAARSGTESRRSSELWYWAQSVRIGARLLVSRRAARGKKLPKGDRGMTTFSRDLSHSVRAMIKNPGFTAVVVITLALGIGANAAIFSIVDALVLRPFPIPEIDRLAKFFTTTPNSDWDRNGIAPADYLDWQEQSEVIEEFAAFSWWDVNVTSGELPERVQGTLVTPAYFEMLGVDNEIGRMPEWDGHEKAHTAVLSYAFWARRFAGDPDVVGQTVLLNGERYDVIGVAEKDFNYPFGSDIWAPLSFDSELAADRSRLYLEVMGRLRPGATVEDAKAELGVISERLATEYPNTNTGRSVKTMAMADAVVDIGAPAFLALWQLTSMFVLLIACVNVANLLLARGADRQKELSLQLALGAGRFRIVRLLLTENLALALTGAALALPLAWVSIDVLRNSLPADIRRFVVGWDQIDLDWRVLAFTGAAALITALVFGLAPALQASRPDLTAALREGGRGNSSDRTRLFRRNMLVVCEVAIAMVLLVASGLSIRGTVRMAQSDQGYDPDGVMTMEVNLSELDYEEEEARRQFYRSVLNGVRRLSGVVAANAITHLPSSGSNTTRTIDVEGRPVANVSERPLAHYRAASPGYFEMMRIPITSGRPLVPEDRSDTAKVAVVSERFAARSWPGEDPIGRRFRFGSDDDAPWLTVIGVSGDVMHDWFLREPQPTFYVPLEQWPRRSAFLAVRASDGLAPEELTASIRTQVKRADANQPVFNVKSQRQKISERIIGLKYAATIMGVFGAIALVLAAVGIYGVMAYSVSRRTHEIGLRVALGAERRDVLGLTVGRALRVSLIGISIGLAVAYFVGTVMESNLFGVVQLDVSTFAGLAVTLGVVSLLAGYIPARRALTIDPAIALRVD